MLKYKQLPQHIEAVFIHNILKLFVRALEKHEQNEEYDEILFMADSITEKLNESVTSAELEVQERASTTLMIIEIVHEAILESNSSDQILSPI